LVAEGYFQVHVVDYEETFAPVVMFTHPLNIKMAIVVDGKVVKCTIENVLFVPSLGCNILSVGAMD
jgi:hypothetical protein